MSSDSADRLAKELLRDVHFFAGGDRKTRDALRDCGDKSFLSERPDTDSRIEMAAHVVSYLAIDEQGKWTAVRQPVFTAVISHLNSQGLGLPSNVDADRLRVIVDKDMTSPDEIMAWFQDTYS